MFVWYLFQQEDQFNLQDINYKEFLCNNIYWLWKIIDVHNEHGNNPAKIDDN
jgi:hypothetical protein